MNCTPAMTSGSGFAPFNARHDRAADAHSLNIIARHAVREPLPLVRRCRSRTVANVVDGLFTTQLDFGTLAFNGDARWLEVKVASPSGGSLITLNPRQPLTAVPYSLQTRGIFVTSGGNVGIGTTAPGAKLGGGGTGFQPVNRDRAAHPCATAWADSWFRSRVTNNARVATVCSSCTPPNRAMVAELR